MRYLNISRGCNPSYFVKIIWCSRWFCNPPPPLYFKAVGCFICGRRRVDISRYRMICLVLSYLFEIWLIDIWYTEHLGSVCKNKDMWNTVQIVRQMQYSRLPNAWLFPFSRFDRFSGYTFPLISPAVYCLLYPLHPGSNLLVSCLGNTIRNEVNLILKIKTRRMMKVQWLVFVNYYNTEVRQDAVVELASPVWLVSPPWMSSTQEIHMYIKTGVYYVLWSDTVFKSNNLKY